jgi:hypothetical protein
MDTQKTGQVPRPTDEPVAEVVAIGGVTAAIAAEGDDADTEGHSLTEELARTMSTERVREHERMSRESARLREARPRRDGGFLGRFRRR